MAKTISRLATNPKNIPELLSQGTILKLITVLQSPNANADSVASTIDALNRSVGLGSGSVVRVPALEPVVDLT